MPSLLSITVLVSSVFAGSIPNKQSASSGEPNGAGHSFRMPPDWPTHWPSQAEDFFIRTTTDVAYSMATTYLAEQSVALNVRTSISTTDRVSTVWETGTESVCLKYSEISAICAFPSLGNWSWNWGTVCQLSIMGREFSVVGSQRRCRTSCVTRYCWQWSMLSTRYESKRAVSSRRESVSWKFIDK